MKKTSSKSSPKNPKKFGYNCVEDLGRRQSSRTELRVEDDVLTISKRRKMNSTAIDQQRNLSLVAWMIRLHLDYVSSFNLFVRTKNDELDEATEELFKQHASPENFDIAERHDRDTAMRLFETGKIVGGDCLFLKLDSGHMQGIESDRICRPSDAIPRFSKELQDTGLVVDSYGKVLQYCICKKTKNSEAMLFDKFAPADTAIYDGYFTRFSQTRGVSPLSTAINSFQDLYEAWEWTLLKIKLHSLFGLAFKKEAQSGLPFNAQGYSSTEQSRTGNSSAVPREVTLSKGLMTVELKPGEGLDTIESKTPSSEMISYSEMIVRVGLLSLDIPYTCYDSRSGTFAVSLADSRKYERISESKQRKNQYVLQRYSNWKIDQWSQDPDKLGKLLRKARMTPDQLKRKLEWIPTGTPWLDKLNEIQGDTKAVALGVDSRQRICRRKGRDFFKIADELGEEEEYLKSKGVSYSVGEPGQDVTKTDNQGANTDGNTQDNQQ